MTAEQRQPAESQYASMDVMAILSRRPVMQWSDSESEEDSSDQEWDGDAGSFILESYKEMVHRPGG